MMDKKEVGALGLTAIVISAMVGGGVFELPQNMAANAAIGPQLIAWAVTGIGMWFIVCTFTTLARVKPELKNGLYSYAEHGFGKFVGFLVAYGYWICNCVAMVAYGSLITTTLGLFFPTVFTGNNVASIAVVSALIWVVFLVTRLGARDSTILTVVGTVAKLVPVVVFIVAGVALFRWPVFFENVWGYAADPLGLNLSDVAKQVSNTMMVTLWIFIGVEGAVVVSGNARSQKDVAIATASGFVCVLVLYVLVALVPVGVVGHDAVADAATPAMASLMTAMVGDWGGVLVIAGILVSVCFSWLVWTVMLGEMPLAAARDGIFPARFAHLNTHAAPDRSLLLSSVVIQALVLATWFIKGSVWDTIISITSVMAMPCYLLCCLYLWKISAHPALWPEGKAGRGAALFVGVGGTIYSLWLVWAAGLTYLMCACIIYALGMPLYMIGRYQSGDREVRDRFTPVEAGLCLAIVAVALFSVFYLAHR